MTEYREHRRHLQRFIWIAVGIGSLSIAVGVAAKLRRPLPTRSVTMAMGLPGGAYRGFTEQYREILARNGVKLELRESAGALDNLALLQDPESRVGAESTGEVFVFAEQIALNEKEVTMLPFRHHVFICTNRKPDDDEGLKQV